MPEKVFSAPERELSEFLLEAEEPVVVFLGESYHPGSRAMSERLKQLTRREGLRLIQLGYGSYRDWAERQGAFGSPTMLVFRDGRMAGRLLGVIEEEALAEAIHRFLSGPRRKG